MSWRRTFRQAQVQSTPANIDKPLKAHCSRDMV
jgi:hypothetical protein